MFIDRLLENWDQLIVAEKTIKPPVWLSSILKECVVFKIQNVFDFVYGKDLTAVKDFPNVRPQMGKMWFEYSNVDQTKYGLGCISEWDEAKQITLSIFFTFMEFKPGSPINHPVYIGNLKVFSDYNGQVIHYEKDEDFSDRLLDCASSALAAISFMHCKNVVVQSTEQPIKLQKSRERRGKLPLFTFNTLEIRPITKILKEEGESETKGLKYALHICRGHFKDFSTGKGLFGKHKGLYWWDSQVRGNIEIGAVIKDYNISPK
jgi:hypothetical protein